MFGKTKRISHLDLMITKRKKIIKNGGLYILSSYIAEVDTEPNRTMQKTQYTPS